MACVRFPVGTSRRGGTAAASVSRSSFPSLCRTFFVMARALATLVVLLVIFASTPSSAASINDVEINNKPSHSSSSGISRVGDAAASAAVATVSLDTALLLVMAVVAATVLVTCIAAGVVSYFVVARVLHTQTASSSFHSFRNEQCRTNNVASVVESDVHSEATMRMLYRALAQYAFSSSAHARREEEVEDDTTGDAARMPLLVQVGAATEEGKSSRGGYGATEGGRSAGHNEREEALVNLMRMMMMKADDASTDEPFETRNDGCKVNRRFSEQHHQQDVVRGAMNPCVSSANGVADKEEGEEGDGAGAASLPVFTPTDEKDKGVMQNVHSSRYRLLRRIGDGAFSSVYLVQRKQDRKCFAMKYVVCSDDRERTAAVHECEIINSVQGHPNVIKIVDMFMNYNFNASAKKQGERGKEKLWREERGGPVENSIPRPVEKLVTAAAGGAGGAGGAVNIVSTTVALGHAAHLQQQVVSPCLGEERAVTAMVMERITQGPDEGEVPLFLSEADTEQLMMEARRKRHERMRPPPPHHHSTTTHALKEKNSNSHALSAGSGGGSSSANGPGTQQQQQRPAQIVELLQHTVSFSKTPPFSNRHDSTLPPTPQIVPQLVQLGAVAPSATSSSSLLFSSSASRTATVAATAAAATTAHSATSVNGLRTISSSGHSSAMHHPPRGTQQEKAQTQQVATVHVSDMTSPGGIRGSGGVSSSVGGWVHSHEAASSTCVPVTTAPRSSTFMSSSNNGDAELGDEEEDESYVEPLQPIQRVSVAPQPPAFNGTSVAAGDHYLPPISPPAVFPKSTSAIGASAVSLAAQTYNERVQFRAVSKPASGLVADVRYNDEGPHLQRSLATAAETVYAASSHVKLHPAPIKNEHGSFSQHSSQREPEESPQPAPLIQRQAPLVYRRNCFTNNQSTVDHDGPSHTGGGTHTMMGPVSNTHSHYHNYHSNSNRVYDQSTTQGGIHCGSYHQHAMRCNEEDDEDDEDVIEVEEEEEEAGAYYRNFVPQAYAAGAALPRAGATSVHGAAVLAGGYSPYSTCAPSQQQPLRLATTQHAPSPPALAEAQNGSATSSGGAGAAITTAAASYQPRVSYAPGGGMGMGHINSTGALRYNNMGIQLAAASMAAQVATAAAAAAATTTSTALSTNKQTTVHNTSNVSKASSATITTVTGKGDEIDQQATSSKQVVLAASSYAPKKSILSTAPTTTTTTTTTTATLTSAASGGQQRGLSGGGGAAPPPPLPAQLPQRAGGESAGGATQAADNINQSSSSSSDMLHTGFVCLVMEYHEMGDLCRYTLRCKAALEQQQMTEGVEGRRGGGTTTTVGRSADGERKENPLTEPQLLSIAYQIASVLLHLHSQSPPVVHRDMKPENVLIKGTAKTLLRRRESNSIVNNKVCSNEDLCSNMETGTHNVPAAAPSERHVSGAATRSNSSATNAITTAVRSAAAAGSFASAKEAVSRSFTSNPSAVASASATISVASGGGGRCLDDARISRKVIPIVVTDFGLAITQGDRRRQRGKGGGTRPYIAPECWQGLTCTASDVWSLGCVMYALATTQLSSRNVRIMSEDARRARFASVILNDLLGCGYSLAFASFVVSLLVVDPAKRPTAAMVVQCFEVTRDDNGEEGELEEVRFDEKSPFFSNVLDL